MYVITYANTYAAVAAAAMAAARAAESRGSAAAEKKISIFFNFRHFGDLLTFCQILKLIWLYLDAFEQLGFFGLRQMIPWVILLQMHPLTALYDPFGSCYDKVPFVWNRQG